MQISDLYKDIFAAIFTHIFIDFSRQKYYKIQLSTITIINLKSLEHIKKLLNPGLFYLINLRRVNILFKRIFDEFLPGKIYNHLIRNINVNIEVDLRTRVLELNRRICIISIEKLLQQINLLHGLEYLDIYYKYPSKLVFIYQNLPENGYYFGLEYKINDRGGLVLTLRNSLKSLYRTDIILGIDKGTITIYKSNIYRDTESTDLLKCITNEIDFSILINMESIFRIITEINCIKKYTIDNKLVGSAAKISRILDIIEDRMSNIKRSDPISNIILAVFLRVIKLNMKAADSPGRNEGYSAAAVDFVITSANII